MSELSNLREHYIELLRENGFNCFPIPENQKVADRRYNASQTQDNQPISQNENFGYIPIVGRGTAIFDLDHKEKYRSFAQHMIKQGYMVVETGNGWHIPVMGLKTVSSKIELFDYKFQDKKIIEIQGPKQYCVGPGSEIFHDKLKRQIIYQNKGTEKIWDAKDKDFNSFVDELCTQCRVESRKKSRSSHQNMRQRFKEMIPPTPGTSNDYFFQAAIQCNTDGLDEQSASDKIRTVYEIWEQSNSFSNRPWSNIETKIRDVYENDKKLSVGRTKAKESGIDRTVVAQQMITGRKIFSNVDTNEIFENCNGFLEKINNTLLREIIEKYPELEESDYNSILFKLKGMAKPMPPTNKNLIVFKNGVYDKRIRTLIKTDEIADMGFKDYDYLLPSTQNIPTKFISVTFDNIPENEKNAMYSRRLSLVHNVRKDAYRENPNLVEDIVNEEREKIISWILNLQDEECQYEDSKTVRREWEKIASPEIEYVEKNYDVTGELVEVPVIRLVRDFNEKYDIVIDIKRMASALEKLGYVIKYNIIKNIKTKPQENKTIQSSKLESF